MIARDQSAADDAVGRYFCFSAKQTFDHSSTSPLPQLAKYYDNIAPKSWCFDNVSTTLLSQYVQDASKMQFLPRDAL